MPRKRDIEGKRYQVMAGTSTRRSARRHSPGFEQWIHYRPGDIVTDWPEHAPVADWVASGHWKEAEA